MKKYRYPVNIGLLTILVTASAVLISGVWISGNQLEIRHYIGLIATIATLVAFLLNRNLFTLCLGLVLLTGNFLGLSSFYPITTSSLLFKPGSLQIALYWGQPEYTLLLIIYLLFNAGFYREVGRKVFWNDFLSRKEDLVTPKVPDILHSAAADQVFREKVEKFKGLYSNMDIAELTEIANDKRYSPEAKQAASDLIIELKNKI